MSDYLTLGLVNNEAEEALVSALLIDPEKIDTLDLGKEDFYHQACGELFESIRLLRHEGQEVDFVTIGQHLRSNNKYSQIGGDAFLLKIVNAAPSSQNVQSYTRIVVDLAVRRAAYRKAQEFVQGICKIDKPVDETISEFATQVPKIVRVKGGLEHISKYASRHYDRIDRMTQGLETISRYSTGIEAYDEATIGGLISPELVILSGKPGMGKTKFMLQMGAGTAKNGASVGIYEMETDEEEIMDREISRDSHIPTEKFLTANLEGDEWVLYTQSIERYADPRFKMYIDFTPRWSIAGLRADLIRAKSQYGLNVFMVDYLKFISDRYGTGETERLNYISGELKRICRELSLAGVVIHAMNKEGAKTSTPDITSLSQGMDIVYDADKVVLINQHIPEKGEPADNMRTCIFLKSRRKLAKTSFHIVAVKEYPEMGRPKPPSTPNAQNFRT